MSTSTTTRSASRIDADRLATWRAFLEVHARLIEVLEDELQAAEDLPLSWYDVLVQLSEAEEWQLRMQELADAVLLSKSGLTRLVDRMQDAGYVDRVRCDDDRRGTFARLTPQGYATLKRCAPVHIASVADHFTDLIEDHEVEVVQAVMQRISAHLADGDEA